MRKSIAILGVLTLSSLSYGNDSRELRQLARAEKKQIKQDERSARKDERLEERSIRKEEKLENKSIRQERRDLYKASRKEAYQINLEEYYNLIEDKTNGIVSRNTEFIKSIGKGFMDHWKDPLNIAADELSFSVLPGVDMVLNDQVLYPHQAQDLFKFDVFKFIQANDGKDLMSAQRNFYGNLEFKESLGEHEKPYPYLEDWHSLAHPPVKELVHHRSVYNKEFVELDRDTVQSPYFEPSIHLEVDKVTDTELTFGNEVKYLADDQALRKKLELIKTAKKTMYFNTMLISCDDSTMELVNAMKDAVLRGVEVRGVIEGLWSRAYSNGCIIKMRKSGIKLVLANQMNPFHKNVLFHNKMWIKDSSEAVLGGMNTFDSEHKSTGFNHNNRDTDVYTKGPSVTDLAFEFAKVWNKYEKSFFNLRFENLEFKESYFTMLDKKKQKERKDGLRGAEHYSKILSNPKTRMNGVCRAIVQGSHNDLHNINEAYDIYSRAAKQSMYFTSPSIEFGLNGKNLERRNHKFVEMLMEKATSGVDVHLIGNGLDGGPGEEASIYRRYLYNSRKKNRPIRDAIVKFLQLRQHRLSAIGKREHYKYLQQAPNFKAYTHWQYMHGKTVFWDRLLTSIGSYNLNYYSAEKSDELTLICLDKGLAEDMEFHMTRDIVNSVPVEASNED